MYDETQRNAIWIKFLSMSYSRVDEIYHMWWWNQIQERAIRANLTERVMARLRDSGFYLYTTEAQHILSLLNAPGIITIDQI